VILGRLVARLVAKHDGNLAKKPFGRRQIKLKIAVGILFIGYFQTFY